MQFRLVLAAAAAVLLAIPLALSAEQKPNMQQGYENFLDCYAVVDAEYFTNRDMKRGAKLRAAIETLWQRNAETLKGQPPFEERRRVIKTVLTAQEREKLLGLCLPAVANTNYFFTNPFNARISTPRYFELIPAQLERDRVAAADRRAAEAAQRAEAERQQAAAAAAAASSTYRDEPDPEVIAKLRDCDNSAAQTIRSADRDMQEATRMVRMWAQTQGIGTNYGWEPLRRGCSTLQSGRRTLDNKQCPAKFGNLVQSFYNRYYIDLPTGATMSCG